MKRSRKHTWCCGVRRAVKNQYPDLAKDISKERIREIVESGADILTISCPFCVGNLKDTYEEMNSRIKEKIKVIDVIDFIASKI